MAGFPTFQDVSRETQEKLEIYEQLLLKWQKSVNLVSPSTLSDARNRHINDSLAITAFLPDQFNLQDWGSGAGFPGLVIAMARPQAQITLVESDQKKCSFLKTVSRETSAPVTVRNNRIEALDVTDDVDFISARALASLEELCDFLVPWADKNPDLKAMFYKGRQHQSEIKQAQGMFSFEHRIHYLDKDKQSVIIEAQNIARK